MNGFEGYDIEVGSTYGVRRWRVDALGRLIAQSAGMVWKPGLNVAKCNGPHPSVLFHTMMYGATRRDPATKKAESADKRGHVVPADHCGCGFWAYHRGTAEYGSGGVVGVIEASGRTIIGTQGFRAAQAKIVALCVPRRRRMPPRGWWGKVPMFPTMLLSVAVASLAIHAAVTASRWWFLLAAVAAAGVVLTFVEEFSWRPARANVYGAEPVLTPDLIERVRRNYPDVAIFPTVAAMLAEYPVTAALEPTPDTDPEFWTRPAVT